MITRPVALLTDVPPRGSGAPGAPLATRLWPRLDDGWAGRSGVERLVALGAWLRTLHDAGPAGPSGPRPAPVAAPVAAPIDLAGLDLLHRTSLLQWARRLSAADTVVHGSLALETVREEGDGLTVLAPDGLRTAHPALDVGGLYADLVGLARRAQLAGLDPAPYERLLTAFLTGYRGLLGGRRPDGRAPSDLDTYRAAAVRLAGLAAVRSPGSEVDLELARRLVEHCWTLADAS